MACLPQITGGRFFNARSAEQIGSRASRRRCGLPAAMRPVSIRQPQRPPRRSRPQRRAPWRSQPTGRRGSICAPCWRRKTEPVSLPLYWTVFAEGEPRCDPVCRPGANPYVPVPPGRYVVEAREGPVSASQTVDVGDKGPTVAERRPQRRYLAGQGHGAEERCAARRCHRYRSARRARPGGQEGGPPVRRSPSSRAARAW